MTCQSYGRNDKRNLKMDHGNWARPAASRRRHQRGHRVSET
jgi:hypothetical protein